MFADMALFRPYVNNAEKCDETVERYRQLGRVYLAVMLHGEPIGEVILKNIDREKRA